MVMEMDVKESLERPKKRRFDAIESDMKTAGVCVCVCVILEIMPSKGLEHE